jgi:RNA-directed DNA polymerase
VNRVAQAIVEEKTRIIDIDLRAYFDNVQHYLLLEKVARRVQDDEVMHLLKMMLKVTGEKGVPQGGVISPLLSNLYLTEVDRMLEKANRHHAPREIHLRPIRTICGRSGDIDRLSPET